TDPGERLTGRDQPRVVPRQVVLAQGARDDVLGQAVHPVGERITGPLRPRRRHRQPGATPEQQRVRLPQPRVEGPAEHLRVEVRVRPPTVREPPVGVLLRPTRSLGHTVEADELRYDNPHDAHSHNREQRLTDLQANPPPKAHRDTPPPTTTAPTDSRRFSPGARGTAREPPPPADSTRPLQGRR